MFTRTVTVLPKFQQSRLRLRLVRDHGEAPDRVLERDLGGVERGLCVADVRLRARAPLVIGDRSAHRLDDLLLGDLRADRDALLAVPSRRAPVDPVGGSIGGAYDHPCAARATAQDTEAREEPLGLRSAAARDGRALDRLPRVAVDD